MKPGSESLLELIYAGPTVRVHRSSDADQGLNQWICVSFSSYVPGGRPPKVFGGSFFAKYHIPALYVVPTTSNWYQGDDMHEAMAVVRQFAGERPVLAYGSSMGGFGAIAWAAELGARRVMAISPQVSVHPAVVGHFEPRWRADAAQIPQYSRPDARRATLAGIDCVVLYDNRHREDAMHVEMIKAAFPLAVRVLALPFSGHPAGRAAAAAGVLSPLIRALCSDGEVDSMIATARQGYRQSAERLRLLQIALRRQMKETPRRGHSRWIHALRRRSGVHLYFTPQQLRARREARAKRLMQRAAAKASGSPPA